MHDDLFTPRLCLRLLSVEFLEASFLQEHERAAALLGFEVPPECRLDASFVEMRLNDCQEDPDFCPWSVRAIGLRKSGEMIGQIGFHSRPNPPYLTPWVSHGVELGYSIAASRRRLGYATEAICGMLNWASVRHGVRQFVVSISPANVASQSLAAKLGFQKIGGHMDELDGYEDILLLGASELQRLLKPRERGDSPDS